MKVIIVGGVAGGASCAARLRRLDEKAEIVLVERGPYVSYANCGLPYHIGGVIEKESSLLGGNAKRLKKVPPGCRLGDNAYAFLGGFRMWEKPAGQQPSPRPGTRNDRKASKGA